MWTLKGKDKNDCDSLRQILYNRYNVNNLPLDLQDPDVISAFALLDKFLLANGGLTRDEVLFDMWSGTLWLKTEITPTNNIKTYRQSIGLIP